MIKVTKDQFQKLVDANLIVVEGDRNFTLTGRKKKSNRKKYYVTETKPILRCLGLIEDKFFDKRKSNRKNKNKNKNVNKANSNRE